MSIVFVDIDGTLFDAKIGIPKSAIHAITKARENGHKICICTGRPKPDVDEEITSIGFDGYIYSCGCVVDVDEQTLFQEVIPLPLLNELLEKLSRIGIGYNLEGTHISYLDDLAISFFQHLFIHEQGMNTEMARTYMASINMKSICELREEDKAQVVKFSIFSRNLNDFEDIKQQLPSSCDFMVHSFGGTDIYNGEISLAHITKATGMDILLDYFNIPLSESIGIGDSMNDLSMIQHSAIGICMENGSKELKQHANEICPSIFDDGLYLSFKKHKLL